MFLSCSETIHYMIGTPRVGLTVRCVAGERAAAAWDHQAQGGGAALRWAELLIRPWLGEQGRQKVHMHGLPNTHLL